MKLFITFTVRRVLLVGLFGVTGGAVFGQVFTQAKRETELEKARQLVAAKNVALPKLDPFHSEAFRELMGLNEKPVLASSDAKPLGPRNNRELLQAIASALKPSGYYVFGGEPTLVFGQKRVKAGGLLTITFEGTEYTLEVANVDRTNFTLRLNRDEFTRPIK